MVRSEPPPPQVRYYVNANTYYTFDEEYLKYFGSNDIPAILKALQEDEAFPPVPVASSSQSESFFQLAPRYDLIDTRWQPPINLKGLDK